MDGDNKKNKPLSEKYGVTGYPTIKFFSQDNKEPEAYEGGRSEADFVKFLNDKCGTQRAVGGGLSDEVRNPRCLIGAPIDRNHRLDAWQSSIAWLTNSSWLPEMQETRFTRKPPF